MINVLRLSFAVCKHAANFKELSQAVESKVHSSAHVLFSVMQQVAERTEQAFHKAIVTLRADTASLRERLQCFSQPAGLITALTGS